MFHATLANATDLATWSQRLEARSKLPHLLRKLVHADTTVLERCAFATDEGVQVGGYDGLVKNRSRTHYTPAGTSVWELGTNSGVRGKADDDYEKRTASPGEISPQEATFIFVTSRRWSNKQEWVGEKLAEARWKDVRAYDAEDLLAWAESAPGVHIWLTMMIGKLPAGASDLASYWEQWSSETQPVWTPGLAVCGREEARTAVQQSLMSAPEVFAVRAETVREAVAFISASIAQMPEAERETLGARAIVITEAEAWKHLVLGPSPLILIPTFADRSIVPAAVQRGHHVILPLGLDEKAGRPGVELPRPKRDDVHEALSTLDLPKPQVDELATLGRRSIAALRRKLARNQATMRPKWAEPSEAHALIPVLLAGIWRASSEADKVVLSSLSGREYAELATDINRWANEADPFLRCVGDTWFVVSRENSWDLISRYVTPADLARFEQAIHTVLGERDPALDLEVRQRFAADLFGKAQTNSGQIRSGLAEALALIAARSGVSEMTGELDGQALADRIVGGLLRDAGDWQVWASLSSQLPLIAEASPEAFLSATDRALSGDAAAMVALFEQESEFGSSPHTGLLWALELLAWSSEHFAPAALALARLARIDPGGRLANRPLASLVEILLSWHPQTSAPLQRRLAVIDQLRRREPAVAWQLMLTILPGRRTTAHPTYAPKWRDWHVELSSMPLREINQTAAEIFQRLLNDVGTNVNRWSDLIDLADDLPDELFERVVEKLNQFPSEEIDKDAKKSLRTDLRRVIARHSAYPNAAWSMGRERLERLRSVYNLYEPDDLIERDAWLFDDQPNVMLPEDEDWRRRNELISAMRHRTVSEIYKSGGIDLFQQFVRQVEIPGIAGFELAKSGLARERDDVILSWLDSEDKDLQLAAAGYVGGGDDLWREEKGQGPIVVGGSHSLQAAFYLQFPFMRKTWDMVAELDLEAQNLYWTSANYYSAIHAEADDQLYVFDKFVEHGKVFVALHFANHLSYGKQMVLPVSGTLQLLENIAGSNASAEHLWAASHNIARALKIAAESGQVEDARIARLEWIFLPLLEHTDHSSLVLHRAIAEDPSLFAEMVSLVFKAKNEEHREFSPEDFARARLASDLLRLCHHIPGSDAEGNIDSDKLLNWVSSAREVLQERDRADIGDQQIGQILSHSPKGGDGLWPHEAIRDLIDEVASGHIEAGFSMGHFNGRGVTTRGVTEGGVQERNLVRQLRAYAEAFRDKWPRTAGVLTSMARGYERDAHREDLSAELTQDMWR